MFAFITALVSVGQAMPDDHLFSDGVGGQWPALNVLTETVTEQGPCPV